jgi:YHS domain-containing protein
MVRSSVLLCGIGLTLGFCAVAWAGPRPDYPRPCPNNCVPNAGNYGHFPTTWRQWPGESRLEETNPRAVGAQVLPTPPGEERLPAPPGVTLPQPPSATPERRVLPPSGTEILPPPGGILPPLGSGILPPQEPEKPLKSPAEGGGLPGLPVEPGLLQNPPPDREKTPRPSPDFSLPSAPSSTEPARPMDSGAPKEKLPLKEENQPKEQSKPSNSPTLSLSERSSPRAQLRITASTATTGVVLHERKGESGAELSWISDQEPEGRPMTAVHRADPITVTAGTSPVGRVEATAGVSAEPAASEEAGGKIVSPQVALNGYCAVELIRNGRRTPGDLRWTVVRNGCVYRFAGPTQRQQFLADPEAFTPAYSGNDPVQARDEYRIVPGQLGHHATYNGRLYVFSNADTQAQFNRNPQRYAVGK